MVRIKISRIVNASLFFILTFIQIIIVSWVSISQKSPEEPFNQINFFGLVITLMPIRVFGFFISLNPFANLQFTALLVILTAGLQIFLLILLVNIVFSNKNMIQIHPEPLYGPAHAPEETPLVEKTIELVTRVAKRANIKANKIFIYRKAVPNAFSLDLIPVPFLRRPYIVLNTNVLEILDDNEIEAVIAHEFAHIKNGDSLVRLVLSIPRLFLNLVYLFIYLQIITGFLNAIFDTLDLGAAVERAIFFGLAYLLVSILTRITVRFLYSANRQAEYLGDHFAANLIGSNTLINSLIHLGQRSEAMQILSQEIKWLQSLSGEKKPSSSFIRGVYQRFPKTQLNEDIAREVAPKLFLEEKFYELMSFYDVELDQDLQNQLIDGAVPILLEKRKKFFALLEDEDQEYKPSILKEKTIDWRRFDIDASRFLEPPEIEMFITSLITQPDKMVFEHELFTIDKDRDHPGFRARILNIFRHFHTETYNNIVEKIIQKTEEQSEIISQS
ncbi:MAG: M48 family metalloprotease [Candidatus Hodarchaeales archaeon]|jgi:heat shock protein HtpX